MYGELPSILIDGVKGNGYPIELQQPAKFCILRLPTSDELLTYLSAQRSLYRDLGRRTGESEDVPTPKADQALFRAIRLDKIDAVAQQPVDDWDDAEALYAIGIITRLRIDSCERDGQQYVIVLSTLFGATTHTVTIPFQRDMAEYRRNVYKPRDMPHNLEERRFPPEVPCKLYDKIVVSAEGYANGTATPPHHKRAVIGELMSALALLDPSLSPNS